MSIEEQRRAGFEAHMEATTPAGLAWHERDENGYFSKSVQEKWDIWNAALDKVVIELPAEIDREHFNDESTGNGYNYGVDDCRAAIESAGLKVKP